MSSVSILNDLVHGNVSADQIFALICSVVLHLDSYSVDVLHQVLSLIESILSLSDDLLVEVGFGLDTQCVLVKQVLLLSGTAASIALGLQVAVAELAHALALNLNVHLLFLLDILYCIVKLVDPSFVIAG